MLLCYLQTKHDVTVTLGWHDSSYQLILQRTIQTSLKKQLDMNQWFIEGSLPVILRNSMAICDFSGMVGQDPLSPLLVPPWKMSLSLGFGTTFIAQAPILY